MSRKTMLKLLEHAVVDCFDRKGGSISFHKAGILRPKESLEVILIIREPDEPPKEKVQKVALSGARKGGSQ